MNNCIFCDIVRGVAPATRVYEDDHVLAFEDIHPVAPVHVLIIPKKHITSLNDVGDGDLDVMARIFHGAHHVAKRKGVDQKGYRTLLNTGPQACQEILHLHLHLVGGCQLNPISI